MSDQLGFSFDASLVEIPASQLPPVRVPEPQPLELRDLLALSGPEFVQMTDKEFEEWADFVTAEEQLTQPFGWYWLSFAADGQCNGVVILQCHGVVTGTRLAHRMGISPGGQVMAVLCPDDFEIPEGAKTRLLSTDECRELFNAKSLKEHEAEAELSV